jgi:hypothetical protein
MWRCGACGFVWINDEPPDECPNCEAPKGKYAKIEDKAAELIERAGYTNGLHMELFHCLEEVIQVAQDGVDDNLDPACVRIFTEAIEVADVLQQSIKAELQAHVNKGRWG